MWSVKHIEKIGSGKGYLCFNVFGVFQYYEIQKQMKYYLSISMQKAIGLSIQKQDVNVEVMQILF